MKKRNHDWGITPPLPDFRFHWDENENPATPGEIADFFHSDRIKIEKERMCDIGRRMWHRNFVDGNGGNISIRVGKDLILCTPTLISKGFMKPEELCLVDMNGRQKAGNRPATSEILTHIAVYQNTEQAGACVHAHPVHATTFSITGHPFPVSVLPEVEIFLGEIAIAAYRHPGSPEMGAIVGALAQNHYAIIMKNHGAITWSSHLEDAYWKMENLESYAQMLLLAQSSNMSLQFIPEEESERLHVLKKSFALIKNRK